MENRAGRIMKLSEAIRLGIKDSPRQVRETFVLYNLTTGQRNSCALGSAYLAIKSLSFFGDADRGNMITEELYRAFPILMNIIRFREKIDCLFNIIIYLNDIAGESRESIADYVESVEKEDEKEYRNMSIQPLKLEIPSHYLSTWPELEKPVEKVEERELELVGA